MDKKAFGRIGEDAAAAYLSGRGYHIIGRNIFVGHAEVDLLAEDAGYLIFCEVKTRHQAPDTNAAYGSPASAVDAKKQALLLEAAERYIALHDCAKIPRIDVVEVYVSPVNDVFAVTDIRHFENAVRKKSRFGR